jgi:hypothetical protein
MATEALIKRAFPEIVIVEQIFKDQIEKFHHYLRRAGFE